MTMYYRVWKVVTNTSAAERLRSTRRSSRTFNCWLGSASLHILTNCFCPLKWALAFKDIMKHRLPYVIITILILSKAFAWWMVFALLQTPETELTLTGLLQPLRQFSYLVLSSFLAVGVLFKSRFATYSFLIAFLINLLLFLYSGNGVYQWIYDPVLIAAKP